MIVRFGQGAYPQFEELFIAEAIRLTLRRVDLAVEALKVACWLSRNQKHGRPTTADLTATENGRLPLFCCPIV
jgi:hypothetical protein